MEFNKSPSYLESWLKKTAKIIHIKDLNNENKIKHTILRTCTKTDEKRRNTAETTTFGKFRVIVQSIKIYDTEKMNIFGFLQEQ